MKRIAILTTTLLCAACAVAQQPQPKSAPEEPCSVKLAEANVTIAQLKAQLLQLQFQLA